jgi:2-hydroxylaminobenzoate mutase
MLSRLKNDLTSLNLGRPDVAQAALQTKYPLSGDYLMEVRRLCQRGVDDGWLCPPSHASRPTSLCKPSKYFPFSVDAVDLSGPALAHGHPRGEVNLSWTLEGKPTFCGSEPGWLVCAPGSKHVPHVASGRMFVLFFLPNGEIEWKVQVRPEPARKATGPVRATGPAAVRPARVSAAARPSAARATAARG